MQQSLENKVILVTGGTRGIGRTTVFTAAQRGARVVYCGRQSDKLEKTQQELNTLGYSKKTLGIIADISKESDVKKLFNTACHHFSSIDVVINNAVVTRDFLLSFMPNDAWHDVLATNLTGAFLMSKYATQHYVEHNIAGKILTVGSIVQNGSPSAVAYSTSKGGLVGLTKAIAREFSAKGISANVISFGYVETELMATYPEVIMKAIKELCPLKRAASVTEAAEALLFFATIPAPLFNGQCLTISGGMKDIPAISFSALLKNSA